MQLFDLALKNNSVILALGAESAGNFSVYANKKIHFSDDFGDLLDHDNWHEFKNKLNEFLRKNKIKPEIILTDMHPFYKTTALGQKLAKRHGAKHVQVQHHLAHIFSAIGEKKMPNAVIGIALDGTGYGLDGNIWGGEVLRISTRKIKRLGHLENQAMIGGDLAVKEPARMLIGILSKFMPKDKVYKHIEKFYTRNQFELLYNQLRSDFNCQKTSSTGRVLDAASIFLGFCNNKREFKHEPALLLEQNSAQPYSNLKPKIGIQNLKQIRDSKLKIKKCYELDMTYLFKYLSKYLHRDKKRLAATVQLYIAKGLYEITKTENIKRKMPVFLAGGIANNKIISNYLISKNVIVNQKIPRGDAGVSFGQIIYLLANSGN
jgi:hydrogenase maturation protein HypF